MELDRETAAAMRLNIELRRMTESEGWRVAKGMLMEKIALLDSVSSIPENLTFEEMGKQAMFRAHAISLMTNWLKEVEARVDQSNQQQEVAIDGKESGIVRQYKS
jgi:hypothetical protein